MCADLRCEDTFKVADVIFFLRGLEHHWFKNDVEEITPFYHFDTAVAVYFGQTKTRREQAHDHWSRRIQRMADVDRAGHVF